MQLKYSFLLIFAVLILNTYQFKFEKRCLTPQLTQDCQKSQIINKKNNLLINKYNQKIQSYPWTFNQCYNFNAISIESLTFSNKPDVWLNFSFTITAIVNFDIQLSHIQISQFINLVPLYTFDDQFRKSYKAGQKIVYQSPFFDDGAIGHEALRTFNLQFHDLSWGKISCMNFNFVTHS